MAQRQNDVITFPIGDVLHYFMPTATKFDKNSFQYTINNYTTWTQYNSGQCNEAIKNK